MEKISKRDAVSRLEKGEGWISLAAVHNILLDESGIIAPQDVASLMVVLYKAAETPAPKELLAEKKAAERRW